MTSASKVTAAKGAITGLYDILAIFYPPLKHIRGCAWLFLQAQKGTIYFTELAERVEYGNYASASKVTAAKGVIRGLYEVFVKGGYITGI